MMSKPVEKPSYPRINGSQIGADLRINGSQITHKW